MRDILFVAACGIAGALSGMLGLWLMIALACLLTGAEGDPNFIAFVICFLGAFTAIFGVMAGVTSRERRP